MVALLELVKVGDKESVCWAKRQSACPSSSVSVLLDKVEDKLLNQQKRALVFAEVSIAVRDIIVRKSVRIVVVRWSKCCGGYKDWYIEEQ